MLGSDPNKALPKDSTRLAAFLQECLSLGSLRGFKHFETFIRGREELVLCVYLNKPVRQGIPTLMPRAILETYYSSSKISNWSTPSLISPLDEDLRHETDKIIFLVAGYAKYRCPYVWLRSHHDKYIRTQPGDAQEEDNPLQLKSTADWKSKDVSLWEIVREILSMTTKPENPFEVDFSFVDELPLEESLLLTGSLLAFLKNVWIQADPSIIFADKVFEDIKILQSKHVDKIYDFVRKEAEKE